MQQHCKLCSSAFVVSADEEALRQKIGELLPVGVPPAPVHCVACRSMLQMAWRNERILYRRKSDKSGKDIISVYPQNAPFPVYERAEWYSDDWDATHYKKIFDFERPFFEQFKELQILVPRPALNGKNTENCNYCNFAFDTRNCYLTHCCYYAESHLYCYWILEGRDCIDCSYCFKSERCSSCTDCNECYDCYRCTLCNNCSDSTYLYDCRSCTSCFGCVGLRRKSFCLFNEQLTKEEYEKRMAHYDLQNIEQMQHVEKQLATLKLKHPHPYSVQDKCEDSTGDFLFENKNCKNCYQMFRSRDCINSSDSDGVTDQLDVYHCGWSESLYSGYSPVRLKTSAWFAQCWDGSNLFYCDNCQNCSDCFGCIGLQHKKYCVLNTQYTEEEYTDLLQKIQAHMHATKEWGEFFPPYISPFAFNETVALEHWPLSKEEAQKRGWRWQEELPFTTGKETIMMKDLPLRSEEIPDTILNEILACSRCNRNYRIIKQELLWYRDTQQPLPRSCPECRHTERSGTRNTRQLYDRECTHCHKPIQTTYAPDRPEIVYCESCYLESVY